MKLPYEQIISEIEVAKEQQNSKRWLLSAYHLLDGSYDDEIKTWKDEDFLKSSWSAYQPIDGSHEDKIKEWTVKLKNQIDLMKRFAVNSLAARLQEARELNDLSEAIKVIQELLMRPMIDDLSKEEIESLEDEKRIYKETLESKEEIKSLKIGRK